LHRPHRDRPAALSLLITATHQPWEIDRAGAALAALVPAQSAPRRTRRACYEAINDL
jgi:hypothetical protein